MTAHRLILNSTKKWMRFLLYFGIKGLLCSVIPDSDKKLEVNQDEAFQILRRGFNFF